MPGSTKFCVSLAVAESDPEKAVAAFRMAKAAVDSDRETVVFLSTEAVRLAGPISGDEGLGEGLELRELMEDFVSGGGQIFVSEACFKKRHLNDETMIKGASIVGWDKLVEFLSDGTPCVSY